MSAVGFADEDGKFTVVVRPYNNDIVIPHIVKFVGLEPFASMSVEILDGTDYLPDGARKAKREGE